MVLWRFNPSLDLTLKLSLSHGDLELGSILLALLRVGTDLSGTRQVLCLRDSVCSIISSLALFPLLLTARLL